MAALLAATCAACAEPDYVLVSAGDGSVIEMAWKEGASAIYPGSLVKPFLALAYGETHAFHFPEAVCTGKRCWLPSGHGRLGIREAIAESCNEYFAGIAAGVTSTDVAAVAMRFGLHGPEAAAHGEELYGIGTAWQERPLDLARAYAELAARRGDPAVDPILAGMRMSALKGTAQAAGAALGRSSVLAKTGTARCVHTPRGAGDGYAVILYPADSVHYVLLVGVHGQTGRETAAGAARILARLTGAGR
jgi:cell division protein FtsI/penicillin-binding protein 2